MTDSPQVPQINLVASARPGLPARQPLLLNLSPGSLLIRSSHLLEPGQAVQVTIHFADFGLDVQFDAEVVWANRKLGDMALRFVSIGEGGSEAIATYLDARARYR